MPVSKLPLSIEEIAAQNDLNRYVAAFAMFNAVAGFGLALGVGLTGALASLGIGAVFGIYSFFTGRILFGGCIGTLWLLLSTSVLTLSLIWFWFAESPFALASGLTVAFLTLAAPLVYFLLRDSGRAKRLSEYCALHAADAAKQLGRSVVGLLDSSEEALASAPVPLRIAYIIGILAAVWVLVRYDRILYAVAIGAGWHLAILVVAMLLFKRRAKSGYRPPPR
jgi:hypothetical protein